MTREPRRLGVLGKGLLGLGVVLALGLIVVTGGRLRQLQLDAKKRADTELVLRKFAQEVSDPASVFYPPPRASGQREDESGQVAIRVSVSSKPYTTIVRLGTALDGEPGLEDAWRSFTRALSSDQLAVDAWGHRLIYRCPGPVHARGWDLWSCGPNGIDELGQGDDILVGDDVAEVGSGR